MSLFFKSPIDIEILFDHEESRRHVETPRINGSSGHREGSNELLPLYEDGESVSGSVTLRVREGKKVEHQGVKVSLIGSIDVGKGGRSSNEGSKGRPGTLQSLDTHKTPIEQFVSLSYDLCAAGELQHTQSFPFVFKNVAKGHESYRGANVDVTYYVKVTVARNGTSISKAKRFWVNIYTTIPIIPNHNVEDDQENGDGPNSSGTKPDKKPVKLDIGIENCLHIEFEYSRARYSLKDVLVGRIYFLLTRLKIKHMELSIITRETTENNSHKIDYTAVRYEIMDGSPVKGEMIPIRLFLSGYDLKPTRSCNQFSIKNYISLVIIDDDGRRYFKQSEIELFRTR